MIYFRLFIESPPHQFPGLRKIYGYIAISAFGVGLITAIVFYFYNSGALKDKEINEVELETETRYSMKKLKKLEKRRRREAKAKEKQRRLAERARRQKVKEAALQLDD